MTYTQVWDHMKNQVSDQIIQRDEDGAFVPFDEANIDYVEYLAWLDEGNEPTPYTPPATTLPETVPVEDRVATLEEQVANLEAMVIPR
jgi:hypothetical protein